jgi:6-phosphogluconate dehydrogenase
MQIGFIGLGRMGSAMVERLLQHRHKLLVYDLNKQAMKKIEKKGAKTCVSLKELVNRLKPPRLIWVMVTAGSPTEETINALASLLDKGDIVVDGGNSYYKDSITRAKVLKQKGISLLDAGTSGGIWGLKLGYCLMVGGEKKVFKKIEPVFRALSPQDGYAYIGESGSGHFVKMVHNGIEYALLQAYAEGFETMIAKKDFKLNLAQIACLWNQGSVIRSWLLELSERIFKKDPELKSVKGYIADSGEGRWMVLDAINEGVPTPIITLSLLERFRSRQEDSFSAKVIAALRGEFGGHPIKKK